MTKNSKLADRHNLMIEMESTQLDEESSHNYQFSSQGGKASRV
eukprot:CAMPEP_0115008178 /NCGR_PEP_ID=MMETSP0216-20121206/21728_1 /TAXON_ID=223996 /ORGANISM="Protocruzia adherens, Strain Boccale" /LENGTH=42 /DNA_ID= /DNA_START= /DNA_END= /DNA_ORIENTATION=